MPLNDKQQRFCEEYLVDLNATQAAIRAGYSARSAYSQGHDLLKKPDIAAEIERLNQQRSESTGITAERVIQELAKLAFANLADFVDADGNPLDITQLSRDQAAALTELTVETKGEDERRVEAKLADKQAALVALGKHFKLFTDRFEHTGANGGPIEVTSPYDRIASRLARLAAAGEAGGDPGRSDPGGSGGASVEQALLGEAEPAGPRFDAVDRARA